MCGIAGYYSEIPRAPDVLERMVETLHHRGPDSAGYFHAGAYHVGMRRLSINDLHGGDQPLYNADKSIVVLYNGEIYNYPELKKELEADGVHFRTRSDGEVICHLFERLGPRAFERLDGMYAISLWSEKEKKLYLARDIPGEKPLYYARMKDGALVFGSELPVFRAYDRSALRLNHQAVWDMPTFLWVPEPNTIYEGVYNLPRGHYLCFDGVEMSIHPIVNRFDRWAVSETDSWNDVVAKTREAVTHVVKSRLLADVPVGAFLSSGLDSSIVATIAQQELGNLTTFSIGYHADAVDPYEGHADESAEAAAYAKVLGTTHQILRVTGDDFKQSLELFVARAGQPYAVSSGLGVMAVARHAREHGIKTLLSGDGADELFGGYAWYRYFAHPARQHPVPVKEDDVVSMHNFGMKPEDMIAQISSYDGPKQAWAWHYYAAESEKVSLFAREPFADAASSLRIFESYKRGAWDSMDFIRQDRACYLPFEMMVKLDRMTMAHSVEGRAPLVGPALLKLADGLRFEHMLKGDTLKPVLREAFADLLPESVTGRPKHGFRVPIDHWLSGDWKDLVDGTFAPSSALSRAGFLAKNAGDTARTMLSDKKRIHGHSVLCYIMLNLWLEQNPT